MPRSSILAGLLLSGLAMSAAPAGQSGPGLDLGRLYAGAADGEWIRLEGSVPHARLDRAGGASGAPIQIHGPATLRMNPVGGSDTLNIHRAGPTELHQLTLEPDDRAAVMFSTGRTHSGIHFRDCRIGLASGKGWNAETNQGFQGKWGVLSYQLDDFRFEGGEVVGIGKEHCFYHHNPRARSPDRHAIVLQDVTMKWARRTAVQVVSRQHEGPRGQGNVIVDRCRIEDVCLEDQGGGSALTFRGNLDGVVLIKDTRVHLGGNPRLHQSLSKNITGALVMDTGSGAGSSGTRELFLHGCHFEVGPHHVGEGSARRPNVMVSHVGKLTIQKTTILNHPGADAALSLDAETIRSIVLDRNNRVVGDVLVNGVGEFRDPERTGAGYRRLVELIDASATDQREAPLLGRFRLVEE